MNPGAVSSKDMVIQKSQRERSRVRSSQEVIDEAFKEIQTKDARTSIMTWLYAERKMVFFFLVHLVATMLVYQHFFLKKFREKQDATPAAANRYNWKVYVPSLEFGAMHAILFQMALLPLTMCRYAITRLSDTWLKNIIPFNRIVDMHIHLGYTMVIIVFFSVFGFFSFFGLMCEEQKVGIEPLVNGERSFCDKFTAEIMATGYGILGALLIIGATSYFRHQIPYELFYLVHHLVFAMFAITIAHTVDVDQRRGIVERSQTFKWFVAPLIIYFTDRFFMRSTMQPMKIESSESIGTEDTAKAVILSLRKPMNFGFQAGQYAFLNFTEIDYTWHPFSIAADPGEEVLSFYIEVSENKTSWTYKLWEMGMLNPSHKMRTKTVNVLGPYGSKYDMSSASHLLMIGAGTGIVPMLSALKVAVRNFVQLDAKTFFHHDTFKNTRANELASNHKQLSRSLSNMAMRGGSKLGDSLSNLSGHGSGHGSAHGRGSGLGGGGSAHSNNGSKRWSGTSNISNTTNTSNGSISASSAARGKGTFDRIAALNDKEKDGGSSSSVMATIAGEECKDQNLDRQGRNGDEGEDEEGLDLIVGPASVADSEIYGCSSFTAATTTTTTAARAGDLDVEEAGFRAAGEGGEEGVDDVEDVELSRERVAARVHRLHIRETMRLFLLLVPVSEIVFAGLVLSWHAERWNMDRYYMAKTLEVGSIINVALFGFVWLCSFDAMFFAYWIDVTFIAVSILALVYWHNQFGTFDDVRIMAYVGLSAYRVMRGWMMSHLTLQDDVRALISKAGVDTVANVVSFRLVWINRDAKRVEFLWPLLDGIYSNLESKWGSEYAARALHIEVYVTDSDPQALASLKQSILGTNLYSVIVRNQERAAKLAKGGGRTTRRSNLILHFGRPNIPELIKDQVSRRFPKIGSSPLLSPAAAAIAPPGSAVSSRRGVGADGTRSGSVCGGGLLAKAVQNAGSASDSVSSAEWEEGNGESETSSTLVAFCGSPALGGIVAAGVIDMQIVAYATKNRLHTVDFYQENYGIAKDKSRKYKAGDGLDVDGEVQMVSKQLK